MAQQIKIKRSNKTDLPPQGSLTMGELAYTEVAGIRRLFVGKADNLTPFEIAGDNYALLKSPMFCGIPTAPTAPFGTNTDQIATTAFVTSSANIKVNAILSESDFKSKEDGFYIFAIEPKDGLPDGIDLHDIAQLYEGKWSLFTSFKDSPPSINVGTSEIQTYGKSNCEWRPLISEEIISTSYPTANTISEWDDNKNFIANNYAAGVSTIVTSPTALKLSSSSPKIQRFTGTMPQVICLPDAKTFPCSGFEFKFQNDSSGILTIQTNDEKILTLIPPLLDAEVTLIDNKTNVGIWHTLIPENGSVSTASFYGFYISGALNSTYNHLLLDSGVGNFTIYKDYSDSMISGGGISFYIATDGHLIAVF